MNILFVLYGDFSSNSAIHLAIHARELDLLGNACAVAVPSNVESISQLQSPAFRPLLYSDVLAKPEQVFPDGRPADIIHAWTPREIVRRFVMSYLAIRPTPLLVYLEDNEAWISCRALGLNDNGMFEETEQSIALRVPADLAHPLIYDSFIGLADAVAVIQDKLATEVPPWVYCETVMPGVDLQFFSPRAGNPLLRERYGIADNEKVIVYPGGLNGFTKSSIEMLCRAVYLINKQGYPCRLLRTGPFALDFIDQLPPESATVINDLGVLPRGDLPDLLALADVFVQPGKIDPFEDLRLPGKLPELLAMGRPVVMPDVNIAHLFKDDVDAVLMRQGSAEEIAEKCIALFADSQKAESIGQAGRRFAERYFDPKSQVRRLESVYQIACDKFNPLIAKELWQSEDQQESAALLLARKLKLLAELPDVVVDFGAPELLKRHARYIETIQRRVNGLEVGINNRDRHIAQLNEDVSSRDSQIASLNQAVSERDSQIALLNQAVSERDSQIALLNQAVSDRDHQISALYSSTSWRITKVLRLFGHNVKRARRVAELAMPALKHGGGAKNTLRKAIRIYKKEGLQGIKRGFRVVAAFRGTSDVKDLDPVYRQPMSHPVEKLLAPRVLIVAEMSIPQCKKYRVEQKHEMFGLLDVDCTALNWHDTQACLDALQTHSLVIFYRVPAFPNAVSIINEAKRLRIPTIWEVDDFIFDKDVLGNSRTLAALDKQTFDQLLEGAVLYREAMLMCDKGVASTTGLGEAMNVAGLSEVHVIENALDQHTLEVAEKICQGHVRRQDSIIRIVYGSGTNTHNIDFLEAAPAIVRIMDKFPNVRFRLIGHLDLPEYFSDYEKQVERMPGCSYEEYLTKLAECDISIAPLESYIFNDSKSNIKYLEASIVKVASVCSPRAAFAQVIKHGENGFLCETDDEWEAAIELLVTDAAKRSEISEAAYLSVMSRYSPGSIAKNQVAPLLACYDRSPNMLRVLSVNCYYHPRSFGGATIVAEEINKLINAQDGFEVHVFTTLPPSVVSPYSTRRYEHNGINIYGVGLPDVLDEKTQFENPAIVKAFTNVLAVVKPDIVHFHSIQGIGVSVVNLCSERNIPYIVTLHDAWWLCARQFMINRQGKFCEQDVINQEVCSTCAENKNLNIYRSERLIAALNNASALLAPSRFFADFYVANGFANVQVNKNGILKPSSTQRFRREGAIRFGYVGGNTEIKGFHLIKKVFSDLAGFNTRLVLVDNALNLGFSSYHQQDLIGIHNLEIVPAYNQSTIDDFFSSIDVLLFPTQWKESFGLTVREALARNVWVIATDAGGVVEDIEPGKNGYIIPISDTGDALKQAIVDTLRYFEHIRPGDEVSLGTSDVTFFEDQAAELLTILKRVGAGEGQHL